MRRTGIDQIINHKRMIVTRIDITQIGRMILGTFNNGMQSAHPLYDMSF